MLQWLVRNTPAPAPQRSLHASATRRRAFAWQLTSKARGGSRKQTMAMNLNMAGGAQGMMKEGTHFSLDDARKTDGVDEAVLRGKTLVPRRPRNSSPK